MTDDQNLGSAFGDKGTKANQIAYGHPYGEKILEEAKEVLRESETGKLLIKVHKVHNIPIHVIKGNGSSGFNPAAGVIYLQIPGTKDCSDSEVVINLIRGLREADQHILGYVAPDPSKDIMEYAKVMHGKNIDSIMYICKVVKELTNSSYFQELLDELKKFKYYGFYTAYVNNASKEEMIKAYAET